MDLALLVGIHPGHCHVKGALWPLCHRWLPQMASEGLFLQWALNGAFSPPHLLILALSTHLTLLV